MDYRRRYAGRIWIGVFLLLAGTVLLLHQQGDIIPKELYNWHLFVACLGVFIGLARGFRGLGWLVIFGIGAVGLTEDYYTNIHIDNYVWPAVVILIGLALIFRRKRPWDDEWAAKMQEHRRGWDMRQREWHENKKEWRRQARREWRKVNRDWRKRGMDWHDAATDWRNTNMESDYRKKHAQSQPSFFQEDYIDASSSFGFSCKKMLSKNFKGGHITTFMGHTEIDFTEADISGNVRLDVTQIMGATKIIVPAHWEIRSDVNAVMAGFEDKREETAITNPEKVLLIVGTVVCGGIEVRTRSEARAQGL